MNEEKQHTNFKV